VFFGQTTCGSPRSGRTLDSYSRSRGVNEEIEAAVGVLELCDVIRLPLGLLEHVADVVAALRDA
jgi:hypothetical protein